MQGITFMDEGERTVFEAESSCVHSAEVDSQGAVDLLPAGNERGDVDRYDRRAAARDLRREMAAAPAADIQYD